MRGKSSRLRAIAAGTCIGAGLVVAANAGFLERQGVEHRLTHPMSGDQVYPSLALGPGGGFLVWQDNITDGFGLGISARRLDANLVGAFESFRVNEIGADDQEQPQAALLRNGGAAFVWQGGSVGNQRIYVRFLNPNSTFAGGDIQVSSTGSDAQSQAQVVALEDGNAVVIWSSYGRDGSMLGVLGQRFSPVGQKLGVEFAVNQSTLYNQRNPTVTSLPGGRFFVAWITERYHGLTLQVDSGGFPSTSGGGAQVYDVQVFGRLFDSNAVPLSNELPISNSARTAANPSVAARADGGMLVAWSGRTAYQVGPPASTRDRWDVYAVSLQSDGTLSGTEYRLNGHVPGDQFLPKVAALGDQFQVVWTSLGQDGAREGVFGRGASGTGPAGEEVQVNTFTPSQQIHPAIASRESGDALVVWSSFVGPASFDLLGQRFAAAPALAAPEPPFVSALSQSRLGVTWAAAGGLDVAAYRLYVDGASAPLELSQNRYYLEKLAPGSTHSFRLAYRLTDGRESPRSEAAEASTWTEDTNFDGLPDDWQSGHWGATSAAWPGAHEDSDGDGASNMQELLAGTNPADPESVLRLRMESDAQGIRLVWNAQPGCIYQVQISNDLEQWSAVTGERFAAGSTDSVLVDGAQQVQAYRVVRVR